MRIPFFRPLDRYVFGEWWKIFTVTALGFPLLVIIIDVVDNLEKYLSRNLPRRDIVLSYVYWLPDSMFMVLPAAVLFATVFSIGAFTRHSEVTAAKASGISFYRLTLPVFIAAVIAAALNLALGEVVPVTNAKRADLLADTRFAVGTLRYNFAFAGEYGRVYKIGMLSTEKLQMERLQIERKGVGPEYPTYLLTVDDATFGADSTWALREGSLDVLLDSSTVQTFTFAGALDRNLVERPADMMAKPRSPQEMRYSELTRFITSLERSGGDANVLRVERALKIAIPVTCIIIALFGAPLATSTQRGGTAWGVAVSLATTVIFLMLIQLTKAIGSKAIIPPDYAAWIPSAVFGVVGVTLLARVRT